jgi:undecaprenyl-diphosphatase
MTLLQAICYGIIQGVTEFLPISSSGHLILIPNLLGWKIPANETFAYDVFLQAATLLAVISVFSRDLLSVVRAFWQGLFHKSNDAADLKLGFYIILATIPAGLVGMIFNGFFEQVFNNPKVTAYLLCITAILLVVAERVGGRNRSLVDTNWKDALWVGIFQIFALFPGISRSGATITGGMLRDLDRNSSARFSFLISVPIMIAAGINGLFKLIALPNTTSSFLIFMVGAATAAIVGYISIKWLLNFLAKRSLYTFAIYCILFAVINLIVIKFQ